MSKVKKPQGVIVPMVTPFTNRGEIDVDSAHRIIEHLLEGGVSGIFVLGTTGEGASVSPSGGLRLVKLLARQVGERATTYAGISSNCLASSVEMAKQYFDLGINAVVAHLPWYYKLAADAMFEYYTALAESIPVPLTIYNIPKTTHMSIPLDVVEKLSHHSRIVGIKDSENDLSRLETTIKMVRGRNDFSLIVGVSVLSAKALSLGADGIVPSSGNLVPALYQNLLESVRRKDLTKAQEIQEQTNEVSRIYQENRSLGQSLAALKVAMSKLGLCGPTVLPPLRPLNAQEQAEIGKAMARLQIFGKTSK